MRDSSRLTKIERFQVRPCPHDQSRPAPPHSSVARLTLIISHRSAVAATAHRVYVLAGGRIADEGSHGDLLARGGPYAALWQDHAAADERYS